MRVIVPALTLLAALSFPMLAKADMYRFTFTSSGGSSAGNFYFDLPSAPSVTENKQGHDAETALIPVYVNAGSVLTTTRWYNNGFSFDSDDYTLSGATPFNGPLGAPVFELGSYQMTEFYPSGRTNGLLVVGVAPTPEPSSLLLLATGAAGMATAIRRRRA